MLYKTWPFKIPRASLKATVTRKNSLSTGRSLSRSHDDFRNLWCAVWVKTHIHFLLKSLISSESFMTVTFNMSIVWVKLVTIVCLCWTVPTDAEIQGVVWKKTGEEITIQCRSKDVQEYLRLKMGLNGEVDIFGVEKDSNKITVSKRFSDRLVPNVDFPNVDILIKNLTSKDTGPYWCVYQMFNKSTTDLKEVKGTGSVLLVVTATDAEHTCDSSHQKLVLVSVVIAAAVLLGIIMGFLIWVIVKTKHLRTTVKPRHVTTNDVYEDMRGTLRR